MVLEGTNQGRDECLDQPQWKAACCGRGECEALAMHNGDEEILTLLRLGIALEF